VYLYAVACNYNIATGGRSAAGHAPFDRLVPSCVTATLLRQAAAWSSHFNLQPTLGRPSGCPVSQTSYRMACWSSFLAGGVAWVVQCAGSKLLAWLIGQLRRCPAQTLTKPKIHHCMHTHVDLTKWFKSNAPIFYRSFLKIEVSFPQRHTFQYHLARGYWSIRMLSSPAVR
jgi:hypothetical protein